MLEYKCDHAGIVFGSARSVHHPRLFGLRRPDGAKRRQWAAYKRMGLL